MKARRRKRAIRYCKGNKTELEKQLQIRRRLELRRIYVKRPAKTTDETEQSKNQHNFHMNNLSSLLFI